MSGGAQQAPALVVQHRTKRFGARVAHNDVSFEVGRGEVFGFLGPNGAGKTTMVRTFGTLIAPTSGTATRRRYLAHGQERSGSWQRISIRPKSAGVYLRLTVTENLECFAGLYQLRDPVERIAAALEAVNLTDRTGDPCGALSKGLRQRVGIARASLNDPTVLFLDEPTDGHEPRRDRQPPT